jgi:hypothetical protein
MCVGCPQRKSGINIIFFTAFGICVQFEAQLLPSRVIQLVLVWEEKAALGRFFHICGEKKNV